jgi:hypothetical protein
MMADLRYVPLRWWYCAECELVGQFELPRNLKLLEISTRMAVAHSLANPDCRGAVLRLLPESAPLVLPEGAHVL